VAGRGRAGAGVRRRRRLHGVGGAVGKGPGARHAGGGEDHDLRRRVDTAGGRERRGDGAGAVGRDQEARHGDDRGKDVLGDGPRGPSARDLPGQRLAADRAGPGGHGVQAVRPGGRPGRVHHRRGGDERSPDGAAAVLAARGRDGARAGAEAEGWTGGALPDGLAAQGVSLRCRRSQGRRCWFVGRGPRTQLGRAAVLY